MCMLVAKVFMRTTDKIREVGDTARVFADLDILELWSKVKKSGGVIKIVGVFQNCGDRKKNTLEEESEKK